MYYIILGLSSITVFLLVLGVYNWSIAKRVILRERLSQLQKQTRHIQQEDLDRPFFERVIRPLLQRFSGKLAKKMPKGKRETLEKRLTLAGNPANLTPENFRTLQFFGAGLGFGLGVILGGLSSTLEPQIVVLLEVFFILVGYIMPDSIINTLIRTRKQELLNNLPDVLDLLTVSVEAGLGFDAALAKVVEKSDGPVAVEFSRVLEEIKIGKPRREAMRDLSKRNDVDELNSFVGALVQADTLGVSISSVLRIQSKQMRQQRRQRAEEKAMKAPIKMLIPMVIFIFPALFVVLLGPGVISLLVGN